MQEQRESLNLKCVLVLVYAGFFCLSVFCGVACDKVVRNKSNLTGSNSAVEFNQLLEERETQFQVARGNRVGELAKEKGLNKIVFIANAGWDKDEFQKKNVDAVVKAIEKASGATVTIIAPPEPKEDEPMEDMNFEQFNTLTKDCSDAVVVVDAMLPATGSKTVGKSTVEKDPQEKLDIFKAERKNFVILLGAEPEARPGMKKLVDAGSIIWITTKEQPRPKKKGQKIKPVEPTGDLKKDFDLRYEIKGKDNYGDFFKDMNKK
jgi:hypothetical protein